MVPHGPLNPDFEPKPSFLNPNTSLRKGANVGTLRDERLCSANASRPSINSPQNAVEEDFALSALLVRIFVQMLLWFRDWVVSCVSGL